MIDHEPKKLAEFCRWNVKAGVCPITYFFQQSRTDIEKSVYFRESLFCFRKSVGNRRYRECVKELVHQENSLLVELVPHLRKEWVRHARDIEKPLLKHAQRQSFNFSRDILKRTILGIGSDFGSNQHFLQERLDFLGLGSCTRESNQYSGFVRSGVHRSLLPRFFFFPKLAEIRPIRICGRFCLLSYVPDSF